MGGSVNGNVSITAGGEVLIRGSQVQAPAGDIRISGSNITVDQAATGSTGSTGQSFRQSGLTVSLGGAVINAASTVQQMASNAGKTDDPRMQALAAATAALAVKDAVNAVQAGQAMKDGNLADQAGGLSLSVSLGRSASNSSSTTQSQGGLASGLNAGGDITLVANGDLNALAPTAAGNITVTGSDIAADRNITLRASGDVTLQAAQTTTSTRSANSNSSAAIGVNFSLGSQTGVSAFANASRGEGSSAATSVVQRNASVVAGGLLSITSGRDTTLAGAQASGQAIVADIGGNLRIQSLQDTATYTGQQSSTGFGISVPIYGTGASTLSLNNNNAEAQGDHASVVQQSGLLAGDGGFDVNVRGNTNLVGGAIASSQAAADAGRNRLSTGSLNFTDIANRDVFKSSGYSVGVTLSQPMQGLMEPPKGIEPKQADNAKATTPEGKPAPSASAGVGSASGSQASVTASAVSAGTITVGGQQVQPEGLSRNTEAANAALAQAWEGSLLMQDVQARAQIVAGFGQAAARAVGDYAGTKTQPIEDARTYRLLKDAQAAGTLDEEGQRLLAAMEAKGMTAENAQATLADPMLLEQYEQWKEGGAARVALHAAVGGLSGDLQGAIGAAGSASAMPLIGDALDRSDLPAAAKQLLADVAATALGAALGADVAAAAALNSDANNRQLHIQERLLIERLARERATKDCQPGDQACLRSLTVAWTDALQRVALGMVDEQADRRNASYLAALAQASTNPGSEGAQGAFASYLGLLDQARAVLQPYVGVPIVVNGQTAMASGTVQTAFSATPEQRADAAGNLFPGLGAPTDISPGTAARDERRLEYFSAINGSTTPDHAFEEWFLGGALLNKAAALAGRTLTQMDLFFTGTVEPSAGGYIGAGKMTVEALPVRLSAADAQLLKTAETLSTSSAQGALREYVVDNYFARQGFTKLASKCGADHCFDGVYVKGDTVVVNEVKPMASNGAIQLNAGNASTKLPTQMSDEWIRSATERLAQSGDPELLRTAQAVATAIRSGNLVKSVSGVNGGGMSVVKLPPHKP